MRLEGKSVYETESNNNLANRLRSGLIDQMLLNTGIGDEGYAEARRIGVILQSGMLPAGLEIAPI